MNQFIAEKEAEYWDLAIDIDRGRKTIREKSINEVLSDGSKKSIYTYWNGIVEQLESENKFGYATDFRSAGTRLQKFQNFQGWDDLSFGDFTQLVQYKGLQNKMLFMDAFERFQRENLGVGDTTIYNTTLRISKLFYQVIKSKELDPSFNPMPLYSAPKPSSRTYFLTPDQINQLISYQTDDEMTEVARDMYLFCCLGGGLRFRDCIQLKWKNLRGGRLKVATQKTKAEIFFDLGDVPMKILSKYRGNGKSKNQYVFPFFEGNNLEPGTKKHYRFISQKNEAVNASLRTIAEKLDVPHRMTFHTSRHTFATLAIRMGMKVTTLQRILGHKKISTSQKYWHILGIDL